MAFREAAQWRHSKTSRRQRPSGAGVLEAAELADDVLSFWALQGHGSAGLQGATKQEAGLEPRGLLQQERGLRPKQQFQRIGTNLGGQMTGDRGRVSGGAPDTQRTGGPSAGLQFYMRRTRADAGGHGHHIHSGLFGEAADTSGGHSFPGSWLPADTGGQMADTCFHPI